VNRYCWGNVWSRPGLDRKQRSLLSTFIHIFFYSTSQNIFRVKQKLKQTFTDRYHVDIGILTAIKSWPELGVHVRGAINNGLTELEIREALLHSAVYCGVPAGMEAFKVAERVLNEMAANGEHKRELDAFSSEAAAAGASKSQ
jgi:4-carboxymuconolactone decarboxylase